MKLKILVIIVIIFIIMASNSMSKDLAQYLEQKRVNRLMEIERLEEENRNRFMQEYYRRKK